MSRPFVGVLFGLMRPAVLACVFAAFAQFVATGIAWALRADHMPLPGVLLLVIAGCSALSTDTLVWRVLPIARRTFALARWSIIGLAGGVTMTAAIALQAFDQHSLGYPVPAMGPQLAALWSALGYAVWLPAIPRLRSIRSIKGVLDVGLLVLLLWLGVYGYPLRAGGLRLPSLAFIGLGCLLLIAAPLHMLLWPNARVVETDPEPSRANSAQRQRPIADTDGITEQQGATAPARQARRDRLSGWGVLIRPLLAQTAAMTVACIGAVSALRWLYPRATELLIWVFLCGVAAWSALVTRRWMRSLWVWRCLPVSSRQLAIRLQILASLPAAVTLLVAAAVNFLAPEASIALPVWLIIAIIGLQSVGEAQRRAGTARHPNGSSAPIWLSETVRLTYPGYVGAVLLTFLVRLVSPRVTWLPNAMIVPAVLLLIAAYATTLAQLRSSHPSDTAIAAPRAGV